jgi:hypothetical protein
MRLTRDNILFLSVGGVLFGIALVLRLYWLHAQSLWLDEGSSWQMTTQPWSVLLTDLISLAAAYPLYHVLLKGWVSIAGDSEWALRLPSALAGALAVLPIYGAAGEIERPVSTTVRTAQWRLYPIIAASVALLSPFALWYAQEAKVYSLLLLWSAGFLWLFLRTQRRATGRNWALLVALGLLGLLLHRLSALLLIAAAAAWLMSAELPQRIHWWTFAGLALASGGLVGAMVRGLGSDRAATGAYIPAGPLEAIGLTFARFSIDRWPGDAPLWWLLPWLILFAWGALCLLKESGVRSQESEGGRQRKKSEVRSQKSEASSHRTAQTLPPENSGLRIQDSEGSGRDGARTVLCFFFVPLVLFMLQLLFTRLYEARYLIVIYPAWVLIVAYPLGKNSGFRIQDSGGALAKSEPRTQNPEPRTHNPQPRTHNPQPTTQNPEPRTQNPEPRTQNPEDSLSSAVVARARLRTMFCGMIVLTALVTSVLSLTQPRFGLFSGDPVKEQYREAIGALAARVHPDDAIIVHPAYLRPLYDYYMGRLSADPAPEPIAFADFKQGQADFGKREWETQKRAKLSGYARSFLLIAPDHARTVDQPPLPQDRYGWVGLHFQYSREQGTWPCGLWGFVGVDLLCQEYPERYISGAEILPETPHTATFDGNLQFLGYTLKQTSSASSFSSGGNVPIALFFDVDEQPGEDYSLFLHLCRDCEAPPVASFDGQPLEGYLPTSSWLPGKPARVDAAIALPADLAPGRYKLLLGMYRPVDASPNARLQLDGEPNMGAERLLLAEIEVVDSENSGFRIQDSEGASQSSIALDPHYLYLSRSTAWSDKAR